MAHHALTLNQLIADLERWRDLRPDNGDLPVTTDRDDETVRTVASMSAVRVLPERITGRRG